MSDESESCKRAIEALSGICGDSTLRTVASGVLPDPIVDAAEGYSADFEVRGTFSPVGEQWGKFDQRSSATGLYFPDDGLMLVDNRASIHHNDQWNQITKEMGRMSPVLPWASATRGDGFIVELGRSHGGLFQAISRSKYDDVERLSYGMSITPKMVLDVAYAARLTDHPANDTEYDIAFAGPEIQDLPESLKNELGVKRQTVDMADVYDLLRLTPGGLPEPLFDRSEL